MVSTPKGGLFTLPVAFDIYREIYPPFLDTFLSFASSLLYIFAFGSIHGGRWRFPFLFHFISFHFISFHFISWRLNSFNELWPLHF